MSLSVLQIMAGAKVGGAEAFFVRLVQSLARAGVEQHAIIRHHATRRIALRKENIPVQEVGFSGRFDLVTKRAIKKRAKNFTPDIVMTWMNRAARSAPKGDWTVVGRLGGYYNLNNYKRCDHLVANTLDIHDYLIRGGWPKERVHYLPNFVDDRRLAPLDRRILNTPQDAPLIVCMGRLHNNKGFDTALGVLARVPEAYLWIAGDGKKEKVLKQLAHKLGIASRVRFLGWREDVPALLAAADIFLCSSRHEPLGNIILEAWAHGTPIVAAESEGPSQLIKDGETGLLAPIDDADKLAKAIKRLLREPRLVTDLVMRGQETFLSDFSEAPVVQRYLDFFERVRRAPAKPD